MENCKMALELVQVTRNTRGLNSREIKYNAIGKFVKRVVNKEPKNADGTPKLDAEGKQVIEPTEVQEFETDGVLTDIADALALTNGEEQQLLDIFARGYNDYSYEKEASKDELDEFLADMKLDEKTADAFKRTARAFAKSTDTPIVEAAELVKTQMLKNKAKAEASA